MAELETFLTHLDSRLEPIHAQLSKLAELQVIIVAVQERDRHQAEEITRLNGSIGEAFQVIRANDATTMAKHELSKERAERLRADFDVSSHRCEAVAVKFDKLSDDYKQKKLIIYGIAIALISLGGAFKWVAADYYARFEQEMNAQREYRKLADVRENELSEQVRLMNQQIRNLHK